MSKGFEKTVEIGSAFSGLFGSSEIVKLLTDKTMQKSTLDRLI